ncbi:MAG: penicillin-binding protein 2 [bacterium]|nr:penicillin-binding protein 2 [bacterium]
MNIAKKRIVWLTFAIIFVFVGIASRIFWLQVVHGSWYEDRAGDQQEVTSIIEADRGEVIVHEKDGLVPIATTKRGWLFVVDPRYIEDAEGLYKKLDALEFLEIDKDAFITKATKADDPYEIIQHRVPHNIKRAIEEWDEAGVLFFEENWRFYPAGDFASHSIGFVGASGKGQYGLEHYYNGELLGRDGEFVGEKTLGGEILRLGSGFISAEEDGTNIVLTIDAGVQSYLEGVLERVENTYSATSAGGIIINPKTGRILALAATPSYNPNSYGDIDNLAIFKNPLIENLYEMGSVIKPLTMAAGLDSGAITPETTYVDRGRLELNNAVIENYDGKARGRVDMQEILSQSLNTGTVFIMEQMGKETFRKYFKNYALAEVTGIDLPNEAVGNLDNLESTRDIEYATASFGQGISMTPIELARALSAVANGGKLIEPYIVEELQYSQGGSLPRKISIPRRVLKEETSKTVTRMLVEVVDTKLGGGPGKGNIPGYSVAAKTGTAQIAGRGGYTDEFMHTFFGYGPAYDPEFLVVFFLEKPRGVRYASETLTEPFRDMMKHLFSYFEILPDRPHELRVSNND